MTNTNPHRAAQAETKLLPCPFCGKNAKLIKGKRGGFCVECQWCGSSTPNWRPNAGMAKGDWNRRADLAATALTALQARAEKAEAVAELLAKQLNGFSLEYDWSDDDIAALADYAKLKGEGAD